MAFIFGFLYRLAMLPMIFTMCIAFFVVHGSDPFAVNELAFIYLVAVSYTHLDVYKRQERSEWYRQEHYPEQICE